MTLLATAVERHYSSLEFAGLPEGWGKLLGLAILALLAYVVLWLYRREGRRGATRRLRIGLALLRCGVLAILAVIWLEPVIAEYTLRTTAARVVVLVDGSASMSMRDGLTADATRMEEVNELLSRDDAAWLRRLAARNELSLYAFGERAIKLSAPTAAVSQPASAPQVSAEALRSDLGQAFGAALQEAADLPLAAVVVLSDGAMNAGPAMEDVVSMARRAKTVIHSVGVGSGAAPANVRVISLRAPTTAAKGDPIELVAAVGVEGLPPRPLRLELRSRPLAGGAERVVAALDVAIDPETGAGESRFQVEASEAGQFLYRVVTAPLPGEALESDNQREAAVIVLDEKLRVLLVAGRPTFEYRYVSKLLERDKAIDVSCWLQSADARAVRDGDTIITELPSKPDELFSFDAVILMDPNPSEFDSSWAINVRRLIDEFGAGLLLQAGALYTSRFMRDPRLEELVACLPVVSDADAEVRLSEQGAYRTEPGAIEFSDEAIGHPLLSLHADPQSNRAIWKALAGAWWRLPVLREKPLATVLMGDATRSVSSAVGKSVLMATQPFGGGRTVFLGFDNTWRWRANSERSYERFWIQMTRFLAQARREGASKHGAITVDRDTIRVGDFLRIEARVLDERFVPWHAPEVEAMIEGPDGAARPLPMKAIPGREGWYAARALVDWAGGATIRVPLPGSSDGTPGAALVKHVRAEQPDLELRSLRARPEVLARLAEASGGQFFNLAEAEALPDRIESASQTHPVQGPRSALWDRSYTLALLAGLLGVEWTLRRRSFLL